MQDNVHGGWQRITEQKTSKLKKEKKIKLHEETKYELLLTL